MMNYRLKNMLLGMVTVCALSLRGCGESNSVSEETVKEKDKNIENIVTEEEHKDSDNSKFGTKGGNDTEDNVFILSLEEVKNYYEFNTWNDEDESGYCQLLLSEPTQYAIDNGARYKEIDAETYAQTLKDAGYEEEVIGKQTFTWWLRTPGWSSGYASEVNFSGAAGGYYSDNVNDKYGVRPAMYIET